MNSRRLSDRMKTPMSMPSGLTRLAQILTRQRRRAGLRRKPDHLVPVGFGAFGVAVLELHRAALDQRVAVVRENPERAVDIGPGFRLLAGGVARAGAQHQQVG